MGRKMRNPVVIAMTCCFPVPPIVFALGNISKKTTYNMTPEATPEVSRNRIIFYIRVYILPWIICKDILRFSEDAKLVRAAPIQVPTKPAKPNVIV